MNKRKAYLSGCFFLISLSPWITSTLAQDGQEPCTVTNSDSVLIVNIVESQGSQISQETEPQELPLAGLPETEVELKLVYPKAAQAKYFTLDGKSLRLLEPLDRDAQDLSSVQLEVICTVLATGKRKTIPLIVTISDINDNAPKFTNLPYIVTIPEDTQVGSVIFRNFSSVDIDSNINGQVEYFIGEDGGDLFEIDLPHQGLLKLKKNLDFESAKSHKVSIIARDRALDAESRLSGSTTLIVNVVDSDDLPPKFIHSSYTSKVVSGALNSGPLEVRPEKIHAEDQDTLRSTVEYEFISGSPPDYNSLFQINFSTGVVSQIAKVSRSSAKEYNITVKATEVSKKRMSTESQLVIKIMAEDLRPPVLSISSDIGYIDENSPVGAFIKDAEGNPIIFTITDADIPNAEDLPEYAYEITSTSFMIDENQTLIVNQANLDRDPPNENRLSFQVFVRELGEDNAKSSVPVTITVNLRDVNDNAPVLEAVPDIALVAGSGTRNIATLRASDRDGDTKLTFNIVRVTNNGIRVFELNPRTGKLDVTGPVYAGDHYALTIEVTDSGGKSSQGVIEVRVTPQPNLRGPVFSQFLYEAQIAEDASKFATVISTEAKDPEGDLVRYAIIGGNDEGHFLIEESTGEIRVATSLDREANERYSLTVKAEDNGGKSNSATVNILITDVNDQSPHFVNLPYSFRVDEGLTNADVGAVEAKDDDIDDNAIVHYSVGDDPDFSIDEFSGMIKTRQDLDFESQGVHYLVVLANDKDAKETASATVTILVQDTPDEIPEFVQAKYQASIAENLEDALVVTVEAIDKDISASVTYEIVSGDQTLFKIDPESGEIRTKKGLDYEHQRMHFLTISTEESRGTFDSAKASCIVEISVDDINDIPPTFASIPSGKVVAVPNNAAIGSKIAIIKAIDADGTEPGNQVHYELGSSSHKATTYFGIDTMSGEIEVLNDLTNDVFDEYTLEVTAHDLGTPRLETSVTLTIRILQVVTMPPELGVGFVNLRYDISVSEDIPSGSVIQTLELDRIPDNGLRIGCEVVRIKDSQGKISSEELFIGKFTDNNCQLVLNGVLDKESQSSFDVMVRLKTQSAFANPSRLTSNIFITIQDENDNSPQFVYDNNHQTEKSYLVTLSETTGANIGIIQIKAIDADSGAFGDIRYSIKDDSNLFAIDTKSGVVRTIDSLSGLDKSQLPLRVLVTASDNPDDSLNRQSQTTELFVNIIGAQDGIVLVIDDTPVSEMELKRAKLQSILEEQTNFIISIDHLVPSMVRFANDTCCKVNKEGTDVYFHVVDPKTGKVLPYDDLEVRSKITNRRVSSNLKYTVSSLLAVQASQIHAPYTDAPGGLPGSTSIDPLPIEDSGSNFDGLPAALIAIGCIVFVLASAAILYLCIMKRKQVAEIEKQPKTIVIPRYQPIFVEPNFKEYETQVLQMSVPIDDTDHKNYSLSNQRNLKYQPSFSLDNISYITKDRTGDSLSTILKTSGEFESSKDTSNLYSTLEGDLEDSFFSREDSDPNYLSASRTNENVIFGNGSNPEFVSSTPRRKKSSSEIQSPIGATTQL